MPPAGPSSQRILLHSPSTGNTAKVPLHSPPRCVENPESSGRDFGNWPRRLARYLVATVRRGTGYAHCVAVQGLPEQRSLACVLALSLDTPSAQEKVQGRPWELQRHPLDAAARQSCGACRWADIPAMAGFKRIW